MVNLLELFFNIFQIQADQTHLTLYAVTAEAKVIQGYRNTTRGPMYTLLQSSQVGVNR